MPLALRIVVAVPGVLFLIQSLTWMLNPAGAAAALGMPLLDGYGRSTQVGDFIAFFLGMALMILWGAYRQSGSWLRAAGLLLGLAAAGRTLSYGLHGADWPILVVAFEAALCGLMFYAASRAPEPGAAAGTAPAVPGAES